MMTSRCGIQFQNLPEFVRLNNHSVPTQNRALDRLPQTPGFVVHMAGPPGGIRLLITWGEDYDNAVRLASKAAKYRSTGSYMGIVIYLARVRNRLCDRSFCNLVRY